MKAQIKNYFRCPGPVISIGIRADPVYPDIFYWIGIVSLNSNSNKPFYVPSLFLISKEQCKKTLPFFFFFF